MALADEKYIRFTTFRRDGTPVSTPVWVVKLDDGKLAFWTSSGSGKAKRLAHTERVTVQPCDGRGHPKKGSVATDATARLVQGAECELIRERVVAKYGGFMTSFAKRINETIWAIRRKRISYADRGVIITLP